MKWIHPLAAEVEEPAEILGGKAHGLVVLRREASCAGGTPSDWPLRNWKADRMEVRQARAADWESLRELRLRALADAPDAFASTLETEAAFPEQVWRQRAEGGAASVNFIASEDGAGIGLAAIFAEADAPGRMHLVGMWVDPRHRRRGVAHALVEQAVRWAEERRASEVILWVVDHNIPARRLYERVGFRPTGEGQPLPSNPALTESLFRISLE
jgi:GNAT superfamily N-acetyltransferase